MKLALIADWLTTFGGAEHVLEEFLQIFPRSPLYSTVARRGKLGPLDVADIRTTRLQHLYSLTKQHQMLLPLMPKAIESIDLRGFDVILSSSHAVAKGIVPPSDALHVCYCHTPMRYAWEMEEQYLDDFRIPLKLRPFIRNQLKKIRRWDLTTAKRVDLFIANSTTTQERIKRIYNRESIVIPPPVNERFFGQSAKFKVQSSKVGTSHFALGTYFLAVCRLVPYKRIDLLIEVANALKLPLKIAGRGQDEARLRAMAGPTVEFLGFVPDSDLPALFANAEAFLFPQYEDAGIVLLEAQATGTPAIAFKAGGATDVVQDGKTGIFFDQQTAESLMQALERFRSLTWDRDAIRDHARAFSQTHFREKLKSTVEDSYTKFQEGKFSRI